MPASRRRGVTGTQAGGTGAQLHQAVPQPHSVLTGDIDLVADGLAGVAGLGDSDGVALQLQGVQRVFMGSVMLSPPDRVMSSSDLGPCTAMAAQSAVMTVILASKF